MTTSIVEPLRELGFTEIECLVYLALLRESPATGYRISHVIDKPTPNTYKAIASLEERGAVLVEEGERRQCRAVPPDELLAALERQFHARRERAALALARVQASDGDDRVYPLKTVGSILARARRMLADARVLLLMDAMPAVLAELRGDLEAAAARGCDVVVKVYSPDDRIAGGEAVIGPDPEGVLSFWPGQQLSLVVDAQEHLLALLSHDLGLAYQGIWSESVFLSCMHHNHLAAELIATWREAAGEPMPARLRARISLDRVDLEGRRRLFARCDELRREAV